MHNIEYEKESLIPGNEFPGYQILERDYDDPVHIGEYEELSEDGLYVSEEEYWEKILRPSLATNGTTDIWMREEKRQRFTGWMRRADIGKSALRMGMFTMFYNKKPCNWKVNCFLKEKKPRNSEFPFDNDNIPENKE